MKLLLLTILISEICTAQIPIYQSQQSFRIEAEDCTKRKITNVFNSSEGGKMIEMNKGDSILLPGKIKGHWIIRLRLGNIYDSAQTKIIIAQTEIINVIKTPGWNKFKDQLTTNTIFGGETPLSIKCIKGGLTLNWIELIPIAGYEIKF